MLTDGKIRKLIAKGEPVSISDDNRGRGEGRLYLKIVPKKNGVTADWYFQWFDQTQKKRRMKIGVVTSANSTSSNTTNRLSLREARIRCSELAELVRQGLDPKQEQELQKIREQQKREVELATLTRKKKENITLAEYWPQYLETAQHKKGKPTLLKEKSHFEKWLSPNLGHLALNKIDLDTWDFLVTLLKKSGLAPRTREYICLTLRQVLNHAFARKLVPSAPPSSKVIGATTNGKDNRRTRILTDEELCQILKELQKRSIPDYNFTLFCVLTGCRASEAFRLKWSNVDLDKHEVTFHRTKNKESRKIFLSGKLVELLKNIPMNDPNDHVFIATQGMPYSEAPSSFRKIVAELKLNEGRAPHDRIVFHSLRHTAATKWGRSNIPLRDLMDAGGWKTASMALRYQHSGEDIQRRAMATLELSLSPSKSKVIPFPPKAGNE